METLEGKQLIGFVFSATWTKHSMKNYFCWWRKSLWVYSLERKLRRKPGSMIKVPGTPGTMTIQHNKNITQNRYENNTTDLKRNL